MWWARKQLRISEELACDDLVLELAAPKVHQYANSLLNMAELLASPEIRPPVLASALNSGGTGLFLHDESDERKKRGYNDVSEGCLDQKIRHH